MYAGALQIVYPHTVKGLITRADICEEVAAKDGDTALEYISKISNSIRKKELSGCFHIKEEFGKWNLCVLFEPDGSIKLIPQCLSNGSYVTVGGTLRNQLRRVRQFVSRHFDDTQGFDYQIESLFKEN